MTSGNIRFVYCCMMNNNEMPSLHSGNFDADNFLRRTIVFCFRKSIQQSWNTLRMQIHDQIDIVRHARLAIHIGATDPVTI